MIPKAVLDEWYPVGMAAQVGPAPGRETMLLGQPITLFRDDSGIRVTGPAGDLARRGADRLV